MSSSTPVMQDVVPATPNTKNSRLQSVRDFTKVDVITGGVKKVGKGGASFFSDFIKFLNRGNVIDLALAVILGGAFSAIVSSFVTDIITPLISLAVPKGGNLADQFIVLRAGKSGNESYASLTIAKADGSITWNWGAFVNAVIYFVIVAALMFLMLKLVFGLLWRKKEAEPTTKACEVCKEDVKIGALKCPHCHTPVPQEEEEENEKDV